MNQVNYIEVSGTDVYTVETDPKLPITHKVNTDENGWRRVDYLVGDDVEHSSYHSPREVIGGAIFGNKLDLMIPSDTRISGFGVHAGGKHHHLPPAMEAKIRRIARNLN